ASLLNRERMLYFAKMWIATNVPRTWLGVRRSILAVLRSLKGSKLRACPSPKRKPTLSYPYPSLPAWSPIFVLAYATCTRRRRLC
ncbi:hypothetical protein N5P37_003524, partial [Trichoderma harzianum]